MYIVDKDNNKLIKAEKCSFKSLGFEERKHLQEWIAKEPSSLGEDLLIIQKEFDGFSDTKERLDLLALDKQGNLVIIENKLDDSGKDVTWQAIKYASYCSSLSKDDVIRIYQAYLAEGSAVDNITEFLQVDDINDAEINVGNSQRIFFVAANFRKEVTSSVLWLSEFGLNMKCFKVTPYKYGEKIMVDFDQIIPIKDAEDYTIKMASKKKEEAQTAVVKSQRKQANQAFWQDLIEYNKKRSGPYATSMGGTDNWIGKSIKGIPGTSVNVVLTQDLVRAEVYVNAGSKERNKEIYDTLKSKQSAIEAELGKLDWQRLDEKVTCRMCVEKTLCFMNDADRNDVIVFFTDMTKKYLDTFGKYAKLFKS